MVHAVRRSGFFVLSSLALAVASGQAAAGGYEKATLWDAKYSALAGAATSSVNSSSAVFFNPAGLANASSNDLALHLSPTQSRIDGPAEGSGSFIKGEKLFSPIGGFTGLYKLNDRLTLGGGVYVAGGAAARYNNVTVGAGPFARTGTYSTNIKVLEGGLALAYKLNNNWSVGGTYRLTYALADMKMASAAKIGPVSVGGLVQYTGLKGRDFGGVRLGTQYRSDDGRWGWGLSYRSEVKIKADGKASYRNGIKRGEYQNVKASARTTLPLQISTGFDYRLNDDWTLFSEVTFSKYNKKIRFSAKQPIKVTEVRQHWKDQWNLRLAGEYTGINGWALRGGYIYTTAVTPEKFAAPTFSSPAPAHTFSFGAGTTLLDGQVNLDLGVEYNLVKNGRVKGGGQITNDSPNPANPSRPLPGSKSPSGKYQSNSYTAHITLRYNF